VWPGGNLAVEPLLLPPGFFIHQRPVVAGDQAFEGPTRHDHDFLGLTTAVAHAAVLGIFAKFAVLLIDVVFSALEIGPIALHRVPNDLKRILAAQADGRQ
jgi:hypothetical protein